MTRDKRKKNYSHIRCKNFVFITGMIQKLQYCAVYFSTLTLL